VRWWRLPLLRQWAERLAHSHKTHSQYNRPAIGQKMASQANRDGVAERCPAPAVPKSLEGDRALLGSYDPLRLRGLGRESRLGDVGCPSPEPGPHGRAVIAPPALCVGRYEGTDLLLSRRGLG
jgi:hypothetical protein